MSSGTPHTREYNQQYYAANRDKLRQASRDWYLAHRDTANDKKKELSRLARAFVDSVLAVSCCVDCGENDKRCLDFDHRDPKAKRHDISRMVSQGASVERIAIEIEKCDIRCANCHRIRTYEMFRKGELYSGVRKGKKS